jgi:hypothetical protein
VKQADECRWRNYSGGLAFPNDVYRWKKQYVGLEVDQVRQPKNLRKRMPLKYQWLMTLDKFYQET